MAAQQEPVQEPPWSDEPDPDNQTKYVCALFFLGGIVLQTYRPLFNWLNFTVFLAELILGFTLSSICIVFGMWMATQIPTLGLMINMVNYHLRMPYMVTYQLMPIPLNP